MEYIPLIVQSYRVPTATAGPWTAGQAMLYLCARTQLHTDTQTHTHMRTHTENYLDDYDEKQSPSVLPMGNASRSGRPSPGLGVPGKAYVK